MCSWLQKGKEKESRRWWVSKLYASREIVQWNNYVGWLKIPACEWTFTRMHPTDFEFLLYAIGLKIAKKDTIFRKAIPIQERLGVILRFLATGYSYTTARLYVQRDDATLPVHTRVGELCIIPLMWRQNTDKRRIEPVAYLCIIFRHATVQRYPVHTATQRWYDTWKCNKCVPSFKNVW